MMLRNRDEQEWDDEAEWGEEDSNDSGYDISHTLLPLANIEFVFLQLQIHSAAFSISIVSSLCAIRLQ